MSSERALKAVICPSLLSSDFARLAQEAERMLQAGADWLHMDIMDGHFVPNLTIGPPIIACLRKHTTAFLDCHCMVSRPRQWISALSAAGASQLTFHPEALQAVQEEFGVVVDEIKDAGMKVGVAIKPNTPLDSLLPLIEQRIDDIALVLVMSVEPGFGGQSFMPDMMQKVRRLRQRFARLNIQVDGGISVDTIDAAAEAGANVIVAGSAIFASSDPKATIDVLRGAVDKAIAP